MSESFWRSRLHLARRYLTKLEALVQRPGTLGEGEAAEAAIARVRGRQNQAPPPAIIDPLIGHSLRLDRSCDRNSGCCDRRGVIEPGTGPHSHGLRCCRCGRHLGWLKTRAASLLRQLHVEGRAQSSADPARPRSSALTAAVARPQEIFRNEWIRRKYHRTRTRSRSDRDFYRCTVPAPKLRLCIAARVL